MPPGDDADWNRVEHLLLRAETLLHAAADSLERRQEERRREREKLTRELDDLRRPLLQLRLDMIDLVEAMATGTAKGTSLPWQARLQEQLPPLERALIELERLLVSFADPPSPPDPLDGEGMPPRLQLLEIQELLAQRHQQVIDLSAEVQRLEGIVRAAGLSCDMVQESGSM